MIFQISYWSYSTLYTTTELLPASESLDGFHGHDCCRSHASKTKSAIFYFPRAGISWFFQQHSHGCVHYGNVIFAPTSLFECKNIFMLKNRKSETLNHHKFKLILKIIVVRRLQWRSWKSNLIFDSKALANEDTLLRTHCCRRKCFPVCPRAQHLLRTQILCRDTKNISDFVQKHFVSAKNVSKFAQNENSTFILSPPRLRVQETSWATMCPQQCVLFVKAFTFRTWNRQISFRNYSIAKQN